MLHVALHELPCISTMKDNYFHIQGCSILETFISEWDCQHQDAGTRNSGLQHSHGRSLGHSVALCSVAVNVCFSCILSCFMITVYFSAVHKDAIFQITLCWVTIWHFDWSVYGGNLVTQHNMGHSISHGNYWPKIWQHGQFPCCHDLWSDPCYVVLQGFHHTHFNQNVK